jgi:hypothetical protein
MNRNKDAFGKVKKVFIFNDKDLTTKLFEFSGIEVDIFKGKDKEQGISFNLNKMENMQEAENYFGKITVKEGANNYKVYYSSTPECDVLHKAIPASMLDLVSIGVTDKEKKITYIAISFEESPTDKNQLTKYTKLINDSCISYRSNAKKIYKKFSKLSNNFFTSKIQRIAFEETANKLKQTNTNNSKELDDLTREKKTFTDKLAADRIELENLKKEQAEKNNMLIKLYSESNNLKEEKAKNDQLLDKLNKNLEEAHVVAKQKKDEFEVLDQEKTQVQKQLDQKVIDMTNTKKEIDNMESELKKQTELVNKIETDLNQANSDIQNSNNKIAENKNKINTQQSNLTEEKVKNVPGKSEDNKKNLDDIDELIRKNKIDSANADELIKKNNNDIAKIKETLKKILNDPDQKINSKKDLANKLEDLIKEYLDNMKQIYPLIPDIYYENIWKMVNVNHSEALNYLFGIRPSIFGIYDNLYSKKHPEIKINDVDFKETSDGIKKIQRRKYKKFKK